MALGRRAAVLACLAAFLAALTAPSAAQNTSFTLQKHHHKHRVRQKRCWVCKEGGAASGGARGASHTPAGARGHHPCTRLHTGLACFAPAAPRRRGGRDLLRRGAPGAGGRPLCLCP